MIVSASYRTDIPAFHAPWFANRLAAGFAMVRNPYGGPPTRVGLGGDEVDGFVFWTRNLAPFFACLDEVDRRGLPFVIHHTITGYPRPLDRSTIAVDVAIAQIARVIARFGPGRVVWRFDPIVWTTLTETARHEAMFAALAARLAGLVDEVVVSCAHIYRKTARNLDAAARTRGFSWRDPPPDEKRALLRRLAGIAQAGGLRLTLCDQDGLRSDGIGRAACIDAERLGRVAGRPITARRKPHRPTCGCWQARDIGNYDTCAHGCVYCYAVTSQDAAKRACVGHDPHGPFLNGAAR
jgi:hypothetical protein